MVSEDASTVVIAGEKYHYIFRNQVALAELLKWKHKNLLTFNLDNQFYLSPDNTVTGKYTALCSCENVHAEDIDWLKNKGFKHNIKNNALSRTDTISGKLYSANDTDLSRYKTTTSNYSVTIISRRPYDTLAKIAFTPVTIAIDTINAVVYGSALLVASPFILVYGSHDE